MMRWGQGFAEPCPLNTTPYSQRAALLKCFNREARLESELCGCWAAADSHRQAYTHQCRQALAAQARHCGPGSVSSRMLLIGCMPTMSMACRAHIAGQELYCPAVDR